MGVAAALGRLPVVPPLLSTMTRLLILIPAAGLGHFDSYCSSACGRLLAPNLFLLTGDVAGRHPDYSSGRFNTLEVINV